MVKYSKMVSDLFNPIRTENNYTELYIDGPDCLSMLLREINSARHCILVQVMLIYSDEAGFKISKALAEKAKEGVEVRVMCDSDMSYIVRAIEKFRSSGTSNFSDLKDIFSEAGIKFVASDKESYRIDKWGEERAKLQQKGVPEQFLIMQDAIQDEVQLNANVLDHRKVIVFDGVTAIVTGLNIGNKYLYDKVPDGKTDRGELWHDGALLIKGPAVEILHEQFASKWMVRGGDVFDYKRTYGRSDYYGTDTCTIYGYFPGMKENHIRDYYLRKIKECRGRFIIENPYINDDLFWQELSNLNEEQARKITIINPYKARGNDYAQNVSAIKCRMWEPFQKGVSFYSYNSRMTHWKIALDVEENEVFLGSYNLNHRSALHDFELNVLVESRQLSGRVQEMLEKDISESTKITQAEEFYQYPNLHPSCVLLNITDYFE